MSVEQHEAYVPGTGSPLFPEHLWDNHTPPKTAGQFARRFYTLQYAISDALRTPESTHSKEVIESAQRAIKTEIERAPEGGLGIRHVKDYIIETSER